MLSTQTLTEAAASLDSSSPSRQLFLKMQVCTRQSGDEEMLTYQPTELCYDLPSTIPLSQGFDSSFSLYVQGILMLVSCRDAR